MLTFHTLLEEVKLRDEHIVLLKRTPFWNLFEAFIEKRIKYLKKFDESSIRVIGQYNSRDGRFVIGTKRLRIQPSDIQLIFGILNGRRLIDTSYTSKQSSKRVSSPFIQRRFPDIPSLRTPIIKTAVKDAIIGRARDDVTDTVRLLCLYICGTLLFATRGDRVRWGFVNYIEDIDNMGQYDWCTAIIDELTTSMDKSRANPHKVTGCILALQVILKPKTIKFL